MERVNATSVLYLPNKLKKPGPTQRRYSSVGRASLRSQSGATLLTDVGSKSRRRCRGRNNTSIAICWKHNSITALFGKRYKSHFLNIQVLSRIKNFLKRNFFYHWNVAFSRFGVVTFDVTVVTFDVTVVTFDITVVTFDITVVTFDELSSKRGSRDLMPQNDDRERFPGSRGRKFDSRELTPNR